MFTRFVEVTTRPGKARELSGIISGEVLSILKSYPGFVDEMILISDQKPNHLLALSFWESKADAEKYNQEGFPRVTEIIRPMIEGISRVETFDLEQSTAYRIPSGKAA
jgi:heme-degrading monooxygenase HmoA